MDIKIIKGNRIRGEQKDGIIKAYIRKQNAREKNFVRKIRPIFDEQEQAVIRRLGFIKSNTRGIIVSKGIEEVLFDVDAQANVLIRFERPLLQEAIKDGGTDVFALTGDSELLFDMQRASIARYLEKQSAAFAKAVNDTTIQQLRKQLALGLEAGETISQLKLRVTDVFDAARGYRAERMARTEMGSAINEGYQEGYMQNKNVQQKEWVSISDDRTRDAHSDPAVDGQVVGKDEKFYIPEFDEYLLYPRDGSGDPANIINCRCRTLPYIPEK